MSVGVCCLSRIILRDDARFVMYVQQEFHTARMCGLDGRRHAMGASRHHINVSGSPRESEGVCFTDVGLCVCLCVCLSVTTITKRIVDGFTDLYQIVWEGS